MTTIARHQEQLESFRGWLEEALAGDPRFAGLERRDREDGSTLATRWPTKINPHVWFEVAVRPLIPQVRVGILTDDRWKSEDFEDKIEESGDTMSEFVELGFAEAGLIWKEPIVEHYREDMKFFYFATALDIRELSELSNEETRRKVRQMLDGYFHAFGPFLK
jgi:hypothetical protein